MALTDEEFREAYKPLAIPSHYDPVDTQENKIIFALAELGEGAVTDVIGELERLEPGILNAQMIAMIKQVLTHHFDQGLLNGEERQGKMYYNLAKITHANGGSVDPVLLAPGLD
jgi:hypothetical protein